MPVKPPSIHAGFTPAQNRKQYQRERGNPAQRGYGPEWRKASREFLATHRTCASTGCMNPSVATDHRVPHKGDQRLFWDRKNWQALCSTCHARKTRAGL